MFGGRQRALGGGTVSKKITVGEQQPASLTAKKLTVKKGKSIDFYGFKKDGVAGEGGKIQIKRPASSGKSKWKTVKKVTLGEGSKFQGKVKSRKRDKRKINARVVFDGSGDSVSSKKITIKTK